MRKKQWKILKEKQYIRIRIRGRDDDACQQNHLK